METIMFTLGILAMVLVALITTLVVGIVKVMNHSKQIKNLYSQLNDAERDIHDRISDDRRRMEQVIVDTHRDINMVEGTLKNQIDQFHRTLSDTYDSNRRYIDSRIDKLIDTYFEHVGAKTPPKKNKELING
jgi:predicted PurR-regulated permease PerM